jgi:hypothetical protein
LRAPSGLFYLLGEFNVNDEKTERDFKQAYESAQGRRTIKNKT